MIREELGRNSAGQRLDRWMRKRFPSTSLSFLFSMLRRKKVRVNGKVAKGPQMLAEGDVVEIFETVPGSGSAEGNSDAATNADSHRGRTNPGSWGDPECPWPEGLAVVADLGEVLVLHKPSGVPSQPGSGTRPGESLVELLWARFGAEDEFRPQLAHRLDQDTSGLLLAARSAPALRDLTRLIRERRVRKEYLALVAGVPQPAKGRIELALERHDSAHGAKMEVGKGVDATTEYQTVKAWKDCALLRIRLETGRMHQIRAHLAHIGCPILGDGRYGDFVRNREARKILGLRRLFLHAALLEWKDGTLRQHHEAPLPPELEQVVARLSESR